MSKNRLRIFFFYFSTVVLLTVYIVFLFIDVTDYNFKIANVNNGISINWDSHPFSTTNFNIVISQNETVISSSIIPSHNCSYVFSSGKHGTLYTISIYKEDILLESTQRLFLDYAKLPSIKTIYINTLSGNDPVCSIIHADSNLRQVGHTIGEKDYEKCTFSVDSKGETSATYPAQIRIRGNTSAESLKKPYYIKLKEAHDLIAGDAFYSDKEWLLLASGTNLNTYVGNVLASYCGSRWQPRMEYINLFVNDDYKGLYILTENVKRGANRVNINKTGFIVENDAYWWASSTGFFRTHTQENEGVLAFTTKYPHTDNAGEDSNIAWIRDYLEQYDSALQSNDIALSNIIDFDTFASYLLCRDIEGCDDDYGSNMYYYKIDNSYTPMCIGPLWDFDGDYGVIDAWSGQHINDVFFHRLFYNAQFKDYYSLKWASISSQVVPQIEDAFSSLNNRYGASLDESRWLDSRRWNSINLGVEEEEKVILKYLDERVRWIEKKVEAQEFDV